MKGLICCVIQVLESPRHYEDGANLAGVADGSPLTTVDASILLASAYWPVSLGLK